METNIILAGVGGQGILSISVVIDLAALRHGWHFKQAEVHGMSQRGGLVTSDIRFGQRVWSPMVPPGEADYLVLLAPSEMEAVQGALKPDGLVLGTEIVAAEDLPNRRSLNVALLGALSVHLAIPMEHLLDAMRAALPEKLHHTNEEAFAIGRERAARMVHTTEA